MVVLAQTASKIGKIGIFAGSGVLGGLCVYISSSVGQEGVIKNKSKLGK